MGNPYPKYSLAVSSLEELCRDENFVISPLNLGMALAMLTAGLRGSSQTELLKVLGVTENFPLQIAIKFLTTMRMKIGTSEIRVSVGDSWVAD